MADIAGRGLIQNEYAQFAFSLIKLVNGSEKGVYIALEIHTRFTLIVLQQP